MSGLMAKKPLVTVMTEAKGEHLRRVLGPWHLTALGIGAVIGAGIFVATGAAAKNVAGPALMLSYVVAGSGLPARRAVLRRVRGHDAGGRQRLYLRLHHARRALRLDHRLGPDPRVRGRRGHRREWVVGVLPTEHSA